VVAFLLLLQLGVLVHRSVMEYHSGAVSMDFAIFYQAWQQIASGNLDPYSTIGDYPYWQSHFELIMWPLAALARVFPSGLTLLVLQDLAIVASEAVATLWVLDVAKRERALRVRHLLPVVATLGLLLVNSHITAAAVSDFHFQPVATFFVLGGARNLWAGRKRRAWCWLLLSLLTGDVAGTYVAGLGLSATVARRDTRWTGAGLIAAGAGWALLVGLLGADKGSGIGGYQHLVDAKLPTSGGGLLLVLTAIVLHPARPLSVLAGKAAILRADLAGGGFLGALHPWTFGVVGVVVMEAGLQESPAFLVPFQTLPAVVFATTGTGMVLDWLGRWTSSGADRVLPARLRLRSVAAVAGAVAVVVAVATLGPRAQPGWPQPAGASQALTSVDRALGPDDQVVASFGIVGRFAGRREIEALLNPTNVPLRAHRVVFVFSPTIGNMPTAGYQEQAAARVQALGGQAIVETRDVQAYAWTPPAGTRSVSLP
jgi:hypothetical protein